MHSIMLDMQVPHGCNIQKLGERVYIAIATAAISYTRYEAPALHVFISTARATCSS